MIESCNWIDFISVAHASWCHWNCGQIQCKAATINQLACPTTCMPHNLHAPVSVFMFSCSGTQCISPEGWRLGYALCSVQWSKPNNILAPTQDSSPGGRIQNHKRWPLQYHCTQYMEYHPARYHTAHYHTARYQTPHYHTARYHTTGYHTACYHTARYHTACYHTACYHTARYHTACYHTARYHTACYHTARYHTARYHTACYHTACYHTACYHTARYHTACYHTARYHTACYHTACRLTTQQV